MFSSASCVKVVIIGLELNVSPSNVLLNSSKIFALLLSSTSTSASTSLPSELIWKKSISIEIAIPQAHYLAILAQVNPLFSFHLSKFDELCVLLSHIPNPLKSAKLSQKAFGGENASSGYSAGKGRERKKSSPLPGN